MESRSISTLLLYPLVLLCNRRNRSRSREWVPSFRFTAPPLPATCRLLGKLRERRSELEQALRGLMGHHQRYLLTRQLSHLEFLSREIDDLDREVARRVDPFEATIQAVDTIPGIGRRTAEIIVAEVGTNMEQFSPLGTWRLGPGCARATGRAARDGNAAR